jgi:hypothetical protein
LSKLIHNLYFGNKWHKIVGYFCNFPKLPKANNRPLGENSPNLVTLLQSKLPSSRSVSMSTC